MMQKIFFILSVVFSAVLLNSCIENPEFTPGVIGASTPDFEEGSVKRMGTTANSITVSATISKENGSKIEERGFCWSLTEPTDENWGEEVPDTNGTGRGEYTMTIGDLENDKEYYLTPYAKNKSGTSCGETIKLSTNPGLGYANTKKVDEYTRASSILVGAKIESEGECKMIDFGVYLYTKKDSAYVSRITEIDSVSAEEDNVYFYKIKDLKPSTKYYFKAFVKNECGEYVANVDSLTTKNGDIILNNVIIQAGYTNAILTSSVSNDGDETVNIVSRGFCFSKTNVTPLITDSIPCGGGLGSFTKDITGLDAETRYYVRAYAINNWGTVYYSRDTTFSTIRDIPTVITVLVNENNDFRNGAATVSGIVENAGMRPVTSVGICWSTVYNPEMAINNSYDLPVTLNNNFSGQLTNLRGGVTYYYRAYAKNEIGTAYGKIELFTTPAIFNSSLAKFPGNERLFNSTAYFTIDDNLYLLGGDLGPNRTDEMWSYSVSKNKWDQRLSFAGGPAKWQTAVSYGVGAYVFGGYDGTGDEKSGMYYYNNTNDANQWLSPPYENPDSSYTICRAIGFSYSNNVFIIGGMSGDTVKKEVYTFYHASKTWQRWTDFPVEQYGGVAVLIDDMVYVGLGKDNSNICNGKLWTSTDAGQTWNPAPIECSLYNGGILAGVAFNRNIYVIDEDYYILEYNTQTALWTRKSQLPSAYRGIHCMSVIGDKIYIGLGNNSANSLIVYDPIWDN